MLVRTALLSSLLLAAALFPAAVLAAPPSNPCNSSKCQQLQQAYAKMRSESCGGALPHVPALPTKQADAFMATYKKFDGNTTDGSEAPVLAAAKTLLALPEVSSFLSLPDSFTSKGAGGLDFHMVRCVVLGLATPSGLAVFAAKGGTEEGLASQLLNDGELMRDMLVAGGASGGKFGEAMQLWVKLSAGNTGTNTATAPATDPWDDRLPKGILRRLALGTALEYAVPVKHMMVDSLIDPVDRYLYYKTTWQAGDLDPAFEVLTGWELRHVVSSPALNEELSWLRETLGHTRPDHIGGFGGSDSTQHQWRYDMATRTDVQYGHSNWLSDKHNFSQIPAAGGECGPRAWFGRFARRAFGLPVWGMKQPGHACMSTWSPQGGWVVLLGASWDHGWWADNGETTQGGPDFVLETQCREDRPAFQQVLRGQWAASVLGETPVDRTWTPRLPGKNYGTGGVWGALMLYLKKLTANGHGGKPLPRQVPATPLVPTKVGSLVNRWAQKYPVPNITTGKDGTIQIPAAAAKQLHNAAIMKSFDDGQQLCSACMYAKSAGNAVHARPNSSVVSGTPTFDFEYAVTVSSARTAFLAVNYSTWHVDQDLHVSIAAGGTGGAATTTQPEVSVPVRYTVGFWSSSDPIEVKLNSGTNLLRFARRNSTRGMAIKGLALHPQRPAFESH